MSTNLARGGSLSSPWDEIDRIKREHESWGAGCEAKTIGEVTRGG